MSNTHPAGKDEGENAIVVNNTLQHNREESLPVYELKTALREKRIGTWVSSMSPFRLGKPIQRKLKMTLCGFPRWMT